MPIDTSHPQPEGRSSNIHTGFLSGAPSEGIADGNQLITGHCEDEAGDKVTIKTFKECINTPQGNALKTPHRWVSYGNSKYPSVITQPIGQWMIQGTADNRWQQTAMSSIDSILVPYRLDYTGYCVEVIDPNKGKILPQHLNAEACLIAKKRWIGRDMRDDLGSSERPGQLPSFRVPENIELGMAGSGVVTSVTLNPFPAGHNVAAMIQREYLLDGSKAAGGWNMSMYPKQEGYDGHSQSLTELGTPAQVTAGFGPRPVGLRGPMVLVGWGYDLDGKPVPNAYLDADIKDKAGVPNLDLYGHCEDGSGDIITGVAIKKDCVDGGNTWIGVPQDVKPKNHFYFNHLKRTDKWKAGPVDLRWDRDRKVWTTKGIDLFLCKATKCILPKAGEDGKNSFNFGIQDSVTSPGRMYRNPCPNEDCTYGSYFPESTLYPDIEIYDPEDVEWCGNCEIKIDGNTAAYYVNCQNFTTACSPFYDAVVIRKFTHTVRSGATDCGDKLNKISRGDPHARRLGDPCHEFGNTTTGPPGEQHPLVDANNYSSSAKALLYDRVMIENPLNQGLMLGDSFISADTGRLATISYTQKKKGTGTNRCGGEGATPETVSEAIPIHIILQAEFVGQEIITMMGCEQGETSACSKKIFVQGLSTIEDCGPSDDYPTTAVTY